MKSRQQIWTITPSKPIFKTRLINICAYGYLLRRLILRDVRVQYHQTLLGPLWFIVQPLLTTVIFVFSFGKVAGVSSDPIPQPLFYLSGIIIWNYFAECIAKTANIFKDNHQSFSKIYFPRILVPLATVIALLLRFGIQFCLLILFAFFYYSKGYPLTVRGQLLIIPILLIITAAIGLGIGLIVSSITIRYRDFSFLVAFGVQLLMYVSPVIFPQSAIPENLIVFSRFNPMSAVLENFRQACFGHRSPELESLIYTTCFATAILVVGLILFKKTQQNFIDSI